MPVAILPALAILAAFVVAWGIVVIGQAFVDALFGILRSVLKYSGAGLVFRGGNWVLSKVGLGQANPVDQAHQWLSDKLGVAADELGQAIAASWNATAQLVSQTGMAIWHTALVVQDLYDYVHNPVKLAKLIIRMSPFVLAFRWIHDRLDREATVVNNTTKVIQTTTAGPIVRTVREVVKPDRAGLAQLRAWTTGQVKALRASIAHAGTVALPLPGTTVGDLREALNRLRQRVARVDTKGLAYIGSGVFVATLARFGLNWIRCTNVKKAGRGICRMDEDVLAAMLAGSTVIVGGVSIRTLARELERSMDEAVSLLSGFVREMPNR